MEIAKILQCTAFILRYYYIYLTGRNHYAFCKLHSSYKVHLNIVRKGALSDPLCDSVNRDLTLVRFDCTFSCHCITLTSLFYQEYISNLIIKMNLIVFSLFEVKCINYTKGPWVTLLIRESIKINLTQLHKAILTEIFYAFSAILQNFVIP